MKKKNVAKFFPKKPSLIKKLVNPRYIHLTGKHDPLILQNLRKIINQSS